jgi:hypothetical protein
VTHPNPARTWAYDRVMATLPSQDRQERRGTRRIRAALSLALAGLVLAGPGATAPLIQEGSMRHEHPKSGATPALLHGGRRTVELPRTVDAWSRPDALRRIDAAGIFEYMDGAGELYLAYRFDHLDVAEYASPADGEILVELYWMRTSDDAYGLLSGDWGGESVALVDPPTPPRALYGAGLLRLWSGDLYARVMATRESDASKAAVLAIGRAIVAGRSDPPPPRLAASLPHAAAGSALRPDTVCFFRSHLVLNSVYFIAQRDILELGPHVEAVTARYGRARLVLVCYPEAHAARLALQRFRAAYLPEAPPADAGDAHIEEGWAAFRLAGRGLALVFEAPSREEAASVITAAVHTLEILEASHE